MALKVLVVEDDVPTLELMWEVLTSLGVEVRPLSDSLQAASLVTQEKFDGVFLDLMMPQVDGFELARRIRQSTSNSRTPIVVVSGRQDRHTMEQAFTSGASFFLAKPVNRKTLTQLLDSTRGSMLEERRRYKRFAIQTTVNCQSDSRMITGDSVNLSQSGILFKSDGSFSPGEEVRLQFRLPAQPAVIQTRAVIVRVDEKKRAGARFFEISPEEHNRIRDWVAVQDEAESKQSR